MNRRALLGMLEQHRTDFMDEAAHVRRAQAFIAANAECFKRTFLPAHITASCWVVDPTRSLVLLMHHRKHDQWFQPGGHCEDGEDIVAAALRETMEETGLSPDRIRLLGEDIFDVDIHRIPANAERARHDHIDVRFLVEIAEVSPPPGNDESHDVRWVPLQQASRFNNNRSTIRMIEKTRRMRRGYDIEREERPFHQAGGGIRQCRYW